MTKNDIVEKIRTKTGFPKKDSYELLESLFAIMKDTLESGEKIKIAGFGNFVVNHKTERRGRNPITGEEMMIKAIRRVTFKASEVLKQTVNER